MNYYIQGSSARAKEIKAAFEGLGCDVTGFDMRNDNILFFTYKLQTGANVISTTNAHLCIANIIKTHPDYKELELPVEPLFKVGDSLQSGSMWAMVRRIDTENQRYICQFDNVIPFEEQDRWSLVPNSKPHYDISNFKPFDKVLVRFCDGANWCCALFSHYRTRGNCHFVCSGDSVTQCIPFNDDTKHLLGTTDMCDERFINW